MKSQTLPPPAPARDPLPHTAKSSGAVSRSSSPSAASASCCNMGHRSHMWPVFRVNSSFSSVIRRQRRPKHAVQHCARHNLTATRCNTIHHIVTSTPPCAPTMLTPFPMITYTPPPPPPPLPFPSSLQVLSEGVILK